MASMTSPPTASGSVKFGLGTDIVEVDEMRTALERTPGIRDRLFTEAEWSYAAAHRDPVPHLAARFAAKEAVMKCLGRGIGSMSFTDIEVVRNPNGKPGVILSGRALHLAEAAGFDHFEVSLTHTRRTAQAVVAAISIATASIATASIATASIATAEGGAGR